MIFINYRKADSQAVVDHLAKELKRRFGEANVFKDDSDIAGGQRWPDRLRQALLRSKVLLAVIGPGWLTALDEYGNRRLDNEEDWVRQEICTALEHGKEMLVLLVAPAKLPDKRGLPKDCWLQEIPTIQHLPLRPGPDFDSDIAAVIDRLSALLTPRPTAPAGPAPRPLPARPPICFGREAKLAELVNLLVPSDAAAKVPGIPLAGVGGIGKSTLVLTTLYDPRVVARYGDGRNFVRLDGATTRAAVVAAVAETVGLPLGDPLEARLLDFLHRGGPRILVLDNAETPLLAEERLEVEDLFQQLVSLPPLTVVATLRAAHPLGPGWHEPVELRRIDEPAARQTFLAETSGRFADDPALDPLLRELEGWPLGVTLLAYQARFVAELGELAAAWRRKRTSLLTKGVKERRADIGACVELSLANQRMTDGARRLLSLLGLLPDGIRRQDLEELLPRDGPEAAICLRQVGGLAFDDGPRLRVLAPVREFLAGNYPPSAEDRERAIHFYCRLADQEGNKVGALGGDEAAVRLTAEIGNLLVMIRLGLQGTDPEPAFHGSLGLGHFSRFTGMDLSPVLLQAEQIARAAGNLGRRADCIRGLGDIALARSDHGDARRRFEEAQPLYERLGDLLGQANCIKRLGDIALARSDHGDARRCYEEARPLYERLGDVVGQANCIFRVGEIALQRSEHAEALRHFEEARPLYERVGRVVGQANCIFGLGEIALQRSEHGEARRHFEEARPLYERVGSVLGQANCIKGLGNIALRRSEHGEARRRFEEARPLYQGAGDVLGQANCIKGLGEIALQRSEYAEARQRYEEARPLYERVGDVLGQANCIQGMGNIALAQGDYLSAIDWFAQALPVHRQISDPEGEGECLRGMGDVAKAQGNLPLAKQHYEEALAAFERTENPQLIGEIRLRLARIAETPAEKQRHVQAARDAWGRIDRPDLLAELDREFGPAP
jgi:tetratricopeptide (TPR) repeat protein